jgi:hypothetical protein
VRKSPLCFRLMTLGLVVTSKHSKNVHGNGKFVPLITQDVYLGGGEIYGSKSLTEVETRSNTLLTWLICNLRFWTQARICFCSTVKSH